MEAIWYIDGKFVPKSQAVIPANDSALMRGCGFFEYARTYNNVPFHLEKHLDRLFFAANHFGVPMAYTKEELTDIVFALIEKNTIPNAGIKMLVSAGPVLDLIPEEKSVLYIYLYPFTPFPEENFTKGIRIKTANVTRPFPECKTTFYLPGILARKQALAAGYDDAAYVNEHSHILECPTSNLLFYRDGAWHTPKEGVLPGLTREVVIEVSEEPVIERPIHLSELHTFDEVITTSTNREVMPIAAIDHHTYPVGPKTLHLMGRYALSLPKKTLKV